MEDEERYSCGKLFVKFLKLYWKQIFLVTWPLVILPVMVGPHAGTGQEGSKFRCMFVLLLMAGYWLLEVVPIHVTALIPVFAFPLLNIMSSADTCVCYLKEVNMMFLGSLLLAICVEHCKLHIRIALCAIMCIGCDPRRLHFAVLFVTFFLSMWMMNTAIAAMMCPIVKAIILELEELGVGTFYEEVEETDDGTEKKPEEEPSRPSHLTIAYYLGITYSTSLGGLATIIGTGTTLTYKGLLEGYYPRAESTVEFVPWLLFCCPLMIIQNVLVWAWLQIMFMGMFRPKSKQGAFVKKAKEQKALVYAGIKRKYKELGKISWHEGWVAALFSIAVMLWLSRKPDFIPGWGLALTGEWQKGRKKYIKDSVATLLILFLMLTIPSNPEFLYSFSKNPEKRPKKNAPPLVTWKVLHEKMPWGLLFLLGGGFALASAGNSTGMSTYIGNQLFVLKDINKFIVMAITTTCTALMTEFASNMATVNVLIPIYFSISKVMKAYPGLLGHPSAIAASYCFLLPVGTPANAIVSGWANLRTVDFLKGGSVIKVGTLVTTILLFMSYGKLFWDLDTYPDWAKPDNTTVKP